MLKCAVRQVCKLNQVTLVIFCNRKEGSDVDRRKAMHPVIGSARVDD